MTPVTHARSQEHAHISATPFVLSRRPVSCAATRALPRAPVSNPLGQHVPQHVGQSSSQLAKASCNEDLRMLGVVR